jgi:hypothetical protein
MLLTMGFKVEDFIKQQALGWLGFRLRINLHTFNNHHPDNIDRFKGWGLRNRWMGGF